jgi:hypothetical protein
MTSNHANDKIDSKSNKYVNIDTAISHRALPNNPNNESACPSNRDANAVNFSAPIFFDIAHSPRKICKI